MVNIKHAQDRKGNIICITDVDPENRGKYNCIQCNGELLARKGDIREHHFAHKNSTTNCSYESYLHLVAKKKFYQKYSDCLSSSSPFYLELKQARKCVSCQGIDGLNKSCELKPVIKKIDLTKYFDVVYLEQRHSRFIADVLLKSSSRDEVLFVEFAVTHKCEVEKLNSGVRIIEIELHEEEDLNVIDACVISGSAPNISFYNFKNETDADQHLNEVTCEKKFNLLTISNQGSAHMNKVTLKQLNQRLKSRQFLKSETLDPEFSTDFGGAEYKRFVREASLEGVPVKNCYACKFGATNNNRNISERTFCKKKKIGIRSSNQALYCNSFWRIDESFEESSHFRNATQFNSFWI